MHELSPLVLVEHPFEGCAVVTLNRPRAMNALSAALRRELTATFDGLERDDATRVAVLTGAGRAFCAGLDLKELSQASDPSAAIVADESVDPVRSMSGFAGPIIGAVNGVAITGGFELALACDVLIASNAARFADTHARVGLIPGWGLSQRLPRLIGAGRAKELSLTGNFLNAERAEAWGLVNRVVTPEELMPQSLALARDMLSVIPEMLTAYKRLIDDGFGRTLGDGLALEKERSRAWAATFAVTDIGRRREGMSARARAQSDGDGT